MAKITFDIADATLVDIDREAADIGLARSPYIASIVDQRNEKGITITGKDEKLIGKMEGIIETLTTRNNELTDRLTRTAELGGIAGQEKAVGVSKSSMDKAIADAKEKWQAELDRKELDELRKKRDEHTKKIEEQDKEIATNSASAKFFELGGLVLQSPAVQARIAGLMGGAGDALGGVPTLTESDQKALEIGQLFNNNLPQPVQDELRVIFNHLAVHPDDIKKILAIKVFADTRKAYIAAQNAA